MADVALLVVEEFEKRRRFTEEDGIEAINRMAYRCVSYLGRKVEAGAVLLLKDVEVEVAKKAGMHHQPRRTSAGLAAFDGVFSA